MTKREPKPSDGSWEPERGERGHPRNCDLPSPPLLPLPDAWEDLKASFRIPPPGSRLRGPRGSEPGPARLPDSTPAAPACSWAGGWRRRLGARGVSAATTARRLPARRPPGPPARSGEAVAQPELGLWLRAPSRRDPPRSAAERVCRRGRLRWPGSEGTLHRTWGRSAQFQACLELGDRGAHQSQTPCAEGRPSRSPGDLVPRQRAVTQFLPAAAAGVARQGQLRPQEERRGGKVAARSFTSEPRRPPGPRSARAEKESSLHPTWGLNSPLGNEVPHSSQEPAIRPPIYLFKGQSLSLNGLHPLGDQQRSSGGPGGWRSFPPASLSPAQATPVPHATKRFPLPQLRVSPGTKVEMPSPGGQSLGSSSFYPPFLARLDRGLSAFLGRPFQSFLKRVPDRAATPSAHGRRRRDPLIPFGRLLRLAAGGVQLGVRERAWRAAPRTIMRRWLNNF
ncbi:uncharacterized protein LOC131815613 [Mustela lutreola]|uniref:uncharacterized protein LOC131815613 n=1 Tax=Mustela lutreola TaxID=9666 RepID=UPI00279790A3|nr:uncharacterized protein LOC131815613 [Mustela lutreola]